MQVLIFLASALCVVTVLLFVAYFGYTRTKDSFDEKMAAYRRAVERAKQRAAETPQEPVLQQMSLRHRRAH